MSPPPKAASDKPKSRKSPHHAWRAHEQDQPSKKLRRKFHGGRRQAEPPEPPRGEAREKAREWFERFPKAAYMTEIESWSELADDKIEFVMRRLPSAD